MDMNAMSAAALGGAVGGALGALIGAGVSMFVGLKSQHGQRRQKDAAKTARLVVTVACVVVGAGLGSILVKPSIESQIDQVPVFATIHKYYPADYAQIVLKFKASQANGDSAIDAENKIRPYLTAIIQDNVRKISDENVNELMAVTLAEAKLYREKDPITCATMLSGGTARVDPRTLIPPDMQKRDMDVSSKILVQVATAPAAPAAPLPQAEVTKLATDAIRALPPDEQRVAVPMLAAKKPASSALEASAMCDFTVAMIQNAMSAEPGALRSLLASS